MLPTTPEYARPVGAVSVAVGAAAEVAPGSNPIAVLHFESDGSGAAGTGDNARQYARKCGTGGIQRDRTVCHWD